MTMDELQTRSRRRAFPTVFALILATTVGWIALASGSGSGVAARTTETTRAEAAARFETERAARRDKVYLTGAHVELTPARWTRVSVEGGRGLWRMEVISEGATFLRAYFEGALREDETLTLVDAAGRSISVEDTAFDDAGFWGPIVFGDRLTAECEGTAEAPPALTPVRVTHGFVDLEAYFDGPEKAAAKEQGCHVDANCAEDWATQKAGVAFYEFEQFGYGALCTGSLLNDTLETGQPWFLTAHHCISTQSAASSLYVVWNKETDACNGAPVGESQYKTNSGADYVVGVSDAKTDFSLLILRSAPPSSARFLDWSTSAVSPGEEVVTIHHPSGAYKRITYGNEVDEDSNYWIAQYFEGSTEGGSSGAPLFDADKKVVGQLFGGYAACDAMNEVDAFGKFSRSWNLGISTYLGSDPEDPPDPGDDGFVPTDDEDDADTSSGLRPSDDDDNSCCGC